MKASWDDEACDCLLKQILKDINTRVAQTNLAHSNWCMSVHDVTVWVDASSLTFSVLESNEALIEDAS